MESSAQHSGFGSLIAMLLLEDGLLVLKILWR